MATSYTRQSSFSDGDTITAALFNDEFNQLLTAFSYASSSTTGHRHDGTAAEGGNVHTIGDQDFLNKIVADDSNNRWGVFVEVSSAAVEQVRFQDGVIVPVTDNDIDLGTSSVEFKDAYFDGTVTTDALTVDVNATVGGTLGVTGALTGSSTVQGTTITATTAFVPDASDGAALGTSALEFSDLFLADGAVINFGDDQDVSLTHVADTGLLLSSTDQLQFGDSGTYIFQSADGILDLVADTEIEINATTIDINGAVAMDGAMTGGTDITISGELDAATLDISGDADIDGTLEADAYTVDGTALNEYIADTVGAMVGSNTETNITVTYEDSDNTLDFVIGTLNQDTSGTAAIATTVTITDNESTNETNAIIFTAGGDLDGGNLGLESDGDLTYNPSTGLLSSTGVTASGTVTFGTLSDGTIGVTAWVDEDDMSTDSATLVPTQQSVKAYVDSQTSGSGSMSSFILEDDDGTEVSISDAEEVKFIGSGITTNWTDTTPGSDADPFDMTFTVDAAQTGITSIYATDLIMGEDSETAIDFGTPNEIDFKADNAARLTLTSSALYPVTDNEIDLGTASLEFKDAFFDGTVTADAFAGPLTGNVTGNASGTALTVTQAAQSAITSLGTLTTLTVDNVIINGTTIGHTDDTDLMTVADGIVTVAGEVSLTTLDIGGTNVTSTAAELNILDGVTSTAAELNILDGVTSTAAELNLMDGGTTAGTTAVASGDGIVTNDGGTMRQTTVDTFDTYLSASTKTLTNKTLTSPTLTTPVLGTPSSGNLGSCTADGTDAVGFRNVPQLSKSAAYTLVLTDSGKHIHHPSSDANARTFTIPANGSVAYAIGTAITFTNMTSQVVTIAITSDTMYLAKEGTTGSRSLAQYGMATALKIGSTKWLISGNGLT